MLTPLARLRRLTRLGWSQRDIAGRLGVLQTTVGKWQRAEGLSPAGHASPRRKAKARRAYKETCATYFVTNLWSIPGLRRRVESAKAGVMAC